MSHFEAAGYSILSFKYDPAKIKKEDDKDTEPISDADQGHGGGDGDALPSLSSLKASLQEIENMESSKEAESANSSSAGPATPAPCPPTAFHRFGDLPTELRIKIWSMSFLPRVVELRPTRPNYAPSRTDDRRTQWQSGCTNPAALSVNSEARDLAIAHFRIPLPLARITTAPPTTTEEKRGDGEDELRDMFAGVATSYWGKFHFSSGKARLLKRTLYVSPEHDTVVTLGLDSDLIRLRSMIETFQEEDPRGEGIRRLGFSVRDWGYGGSAVMLKGLGRSCLKDLDQLILFMYSVPHPPDAFCEKGQAADQEALEKYRRTGNICKLIPCEGSSAWHAYRMWSGTRGRQFWDDDGNIIKVGRAGNDLQIMDLEFMDGW